MNQACLLCAATEHQPYLNVDGYSIVRCTACGFRFVCPLPTAAELATFYQQPEYYTDSDLGYSDYLGGRAHHEELAQRRLDRIERLLGGRGRILDVGCAAGFFLHVAQQRGWQPAGVELATDMADYASRLIENPIAATLNDLDAAPESFDAVTLWEYIEHIPDPQPEIARLTRLLKPGGVLALSTPNTDYWTAVHQPQDWREYKPPAHLSFWTERDLRQLLTDHGLIVRELPHAISRAPHQPYAAHRVLHWWRNTVGNGADRRTPLWWTFSLLWRGVESASQIPYRLRWPASDLHISLEAYAQKPQ